MNDQADLLAMIIANPEDMAPRLVFADWLDDHAADVPCEWCRWCKGDGYHCSICEGKESVPNGYAERAEFIRLQIQTKDVPSEPPVCDPFRIRGRVANPRHADGCQFCQWVARYGWARTLIGRQRNMLNRLAAVGGWRPSGIVECVSVVEEGEAAGYIEESRVERKAVYYYRAGFVEKVYCDDDFWMKHGPCFVVNHPVAVVVFSDHENSYGYVRTPSISRDTIPEFLVKFLHRRTNVCEQDRGVVLFYDSLADKMTDLSQAAIAWAKATSNGGAIGRSAKNWSYRVW